MKGNGIVLRKASSVAMGVKVEVAALSDVRYLVEISFRKIASHKRGMEYKHLQDDHENEGEDRRDERQNSEPISRNVMDDEGAQSEAGRRE
jgi:hypothetical protein